MAVALADRLWSPRSTGRNYGGEDSWSPGVHAGEVVSVYKAVVNGCWPSASPSRRGGFGHGSRADRMLRGCDVSQVTFLRG